MTKAMIKIHDLESREELKQTTTKWSFKVITVFRPILFPVSDI